MRFPRPARTPASVDLTPLIDVVFMLLIFFMVAANFNNPTQLALTLPEAEGQPREQLDQAVRILVSSRGEYYVDGEKLAGNDSAALRSALGQWGAEKTRLPVVITADARADYQAVVRVMDVAGQLGFDKLSLTTRKVTEEGQ